MANILNKPHREENGRIQSCLLILAGLFLLAVSLGLTISPTVRARSWQAELMLGHWLAFVVWIIITTLIHKQILKKLPGADPYLFPIAALLTGWGMLTIWRLIPGYGLRQTAWYALIGITFAILLRFPEITAFLRRYKYLWLIAGLAITALTFILGVNPLGGGPRLWLGCCGVYFQPSEILKFLLIIYLAAYFSDRTELKLDSPALILPTLVVMFLALSILIFQRDLGTASIFLILYSIILSTVSQRKRVLAISLAGIGLAGLVGYFLFDVINLRVDAWLNPWLDPSGRSYQIVQSLLSIANGGLMGRGPGGGSPGLVPVAISDFIFTSIAEEYGLVGTIAFFAILLILLSRGLRISSQSSQKYPKILAIGLTAYFIVQSIVIIGGNIRLVPLTGVTLPFVSYGGSSLLISYLSLLLLLRVSDQTPERQPIISKPLPSLAIGLVLSIGLLSLALLNGWWSIVRGPDLLQRSDNARRTISDLQVRRGSILSREDKLINYSMGEAGNYSRIYKYADMTTTTGYTHPIFGQAGLEFTLDDYLRGDRGNNSLLTWWNHILYGQPPPGLDVRLSIDLAIQTKADSLLGEHNGAIVLINAGSGEVLALASHPTFNPNDLDQKSELLFNDPSKPLLNRAVQGVYQPGDILNPFLQLEGSIGNLGDYKPAALYRALGFYTAPEIELPVSEASSPEDELRISPLQLSLAAGTLANNGLLPIPRLVTSVKTPQQGWVILPTTTEPMQVVVSEKTTEITSKLLVTGKPFWDYSNSIHGTADNQDVTWYMAGTIPDWKGTPLALVVLLEENNQDLVESIGRELLVYSINY